MCEWLGSKRSQFWVCERFLCVLVCSMRARAELGCLREFWVCDLPGVEGFLFRGSYRDFCGGGKGLGRCRFFWRCPSGGGLVTVYAEEVFSRLSESVLMAVG